MKKISALLAGLLLATNVSAAVIAEANNSGGGRLVLTDTPCTTNSGAVAYSTLATGRTLMGCWAVDDLYVHIRWQDNDLRSYPIEIWRLIDDNKDRIGI